MEQKINNELKQKLVITIKMSFKGNSQKAIEFQIPFQETELSDLSEQNPQLYIDLFNVHYSSLFKEVTVDNFASFDKGIFNKTQELLSSGSDDEKKLCQCVANALSISTFVGMANISGYSMPGFVDNICSKYIYSEGQFPNLGFVLFRTGKPMNTKTKFERFILFVNNKDKIPVSELSELLKKIYQSIKKALTSGKQGEAGMKLNNENCFTPPADGMADIMKLIEGIIAECEAKDKVFYGIDCNANNYYLEDSNTYEMEGQKKPLDIEQLIEFYIKMCADHPQLLYLEDPISSSDLKGWKKLIDKFTAEQPEVKIVSQRLFNGDVNKLLDLIVEKEEDQKAKDAAGGPPMRTTDPNYRSRLINNIPRPEDVKEEMTPKELKKLEEERIEKEKLAEQQRLEEEEKKKQEEAAAAGKKGAPKKEDPKAKKKDDKVTKTEGKEEEEEKILPLPLSNISLKLGNFICLSDMFDLLSKVHDKKYGVSLYDNFVESEQSAITEIGFGIGIQNIILNGFTLNNNKMSKILKYISLAEEELE